MGVLRRLSGVGRETDSPTKTPVTREEEKEERHGAVEGEADSAVGDPRAGEKLRTILFDPLKPLLADHKRLFISPDGDLSRLPFEVLPTADGRRLIDDFCISYLSVGRDLLRFNNTDAAGTRTRGQRSGRPIVAADPDFDLAAASSISSHSSEADRAGGEWAQELRRSRIPFNRLPGTRREGEQVASLLGVAPLVGGDVLEERLEKNHSPQILHLATHGFFLPDQKPDPDEPQAPQSLLGTGESPMGRLVAAGRENPLLRSGLALAGANRWFEGKPLPEEAGDGMLNALDVTGLNLQDTELVVLSACETGLGEVQVREGVLGLRRAFVLAGAKTLVMSLWKVPDQQTQELMQEFYRRLLQGQPRVQALREAQLDMKERYPDPYYWGAFICQGEPGALLLHTVQEQE